MDGCAVVFVPHVFGPEKEKDDRIVGRQIFRNLLNKPEFKEDDLILIEDEMDFEELKCIISNLDFLISARMHACINAMSEGVPFINLAYSDKSTGFLSQDVGLDKLYVDVRKVKDEDGLVSMVLERMQNILDDRKNIQKILVSKSKKFRYAL